MNNIISIISEGNDFILQQGAKPILTPKKNVLALPSRKLAETIAAEWQTGKRLLASERPMASLACTALDIIAPAREATVESMLAYAETDLLSYRSENPKLAAMQEEFHAPVLAWVLKRYECNVVTTTGLMPVEQPKLTMARFRAAVEAMSDMQLTAFSVLTQSMGSFILALAVYENELKAEDAFAASRIDEEYQAAEWGRDEEVDARGEALKREALNAVRFLGLLRQT